MSNHMSEISKNKIHSYIKLLLVFTFCFLIIFSIEIISIRHQNKNINTYESKLNFKNHVNAQLINHIVELEDVLEDTLHATGTTKGMFVINAKITSYAPMCDDAIEGWDFAGDPSITASGQKVIPYKTAAGGDGYNFGDKVYILGDGWWIINDRGGGLSHWQIDRSVNTKEEASQWGNQERIVIIDRVGSKN